MTLLQKLAKVRREVPRIEKRGENAFHHYAYAKAEDIADELGKRLADLGIIVARRGLKLTRSDVVTVKGGKESMVEVECDYGFIDADSGEELWQPAYGEGRDSGDKAPYKAFTGALKYFLIQAFLLATGDDPEASGDEHRELDIAKTACPKCGNVGALARGNPKFGGAFYCNKKAGGCGANFASEDDLRDPADTFEEKKNKKVNYITEPHEAELKLLCEQTHTDEGKMLESFGCVTWAEMTEENYQTALKVFERKKVAGLVHA